VLRQKKEMSQKELARALGTSQNAIYRLENPKYGRPNISTLKKLASFYDVGLIVRFAPLSEIADWTINLSPGSMNVPDFAHDPGFIERKPPEAANAIAAGVQDDSPLVVNAVRSMPPVGPANADRHVPGSDCISPYQTTRILDMHQQQQLVSQ
jgi:transcriptional regulator with XRE-family HTH domain